MNEEKTVLQAVDEPARRLAKGLVRAARHAALATIQPNGFPLASRVLVASDYAGHPLLLVSRLSGHTAALLAAPRCSLLFGTVGDGDPLAQPRISVQGEAFDIGGATRASARARFLARHPGAARYCDFADFLFLRVRIVEASLVGGFARAYRLAAGDLVDESDADLEARLQRAVAHMNEDHRDAIDAIAAREAGSQVSGWSIATADRSGFEITRGGETRRIFFRASLNGPDEIRQAFVDLAKGSA